MAAEFHSPENDGSPAPPANSSSSVSATSGGGRFKWYTACLPMVGCGLILGCGILFVISSRRGIQPTIEIVDDGSSFSKVKNGLLKLEIDRLLGTNGRAIKPHQWPQKLGDIPGFENGDWVATPDEAVEWFVWDVKDKHKWIAVAFANRHLGGILSVPDSVARKSGLDEPFPE